MLFGENKMVSDLFQHCFRGRGAFKLNIRNKLQVWISVYYVEWGVVNHLLRGGMRYDPSKNKYVTWMY